MKTYALIASVLALAAATTAASTAGAQAHPTATVMKPAVNPAVVQTTARPATINTGSTASTSGTASSGAAFMASGPYQLDLHAQKRNGQTVNVSDLQVQSGVTRSGNTVSLVAGDMSLTGTVTGSQLHLSGPTSSGGTMTLAGSAGASGSASGTFTSVDAGVTRTGTFTLYPGLNMGPNNVQKKIQTYGEPKSGGDGGDTCGFWCQFFKWF